MIRCLIALTCLAPFSLPAIEIVAHRGFSAIAPENTVAAFRLAWEQGADACELDMHLTADGQIAILHDADTARTTGTAMKVKNATLADLQPLDAGSWKSTTHAGEKIPTLAEALATLPEGKRRFFLEVKCGPEIVPALSRELAAWKPRAHQLCVIAFARPVAQQVKQALPWLKVYRLSSEVTQDKKPVDLTQLIQDSHADGLDGLDLSQKFVWNEALVKQVRDAGLELFVWTVNRPADVPKYTALGLDGITTDDPVMVRRHLR